MDKMHQLLEQLEHRHRLPGIEQFLPLFYPDASMLPDFFDDDALVFDIDPPSTKQAVQLCWERIETNYAEARNSHMPVLPPDDVFLTPPQFDRAFTRFKRIRIFDIPDMADEIGSRVALKTGNHKLLKQEIDLQRKKHGLLQPLVKTASDWLARSEKVILSCRSERTARQLAELLEQHALPVVIFDEPVREAAVAQLSPDTIYLSPKALTAGFDFFGARLHIVSESELFGVRSLPSRRQYKPRHPDDGGAIRFDQLSAGDIVVHREHGIGIYEGLIHMVHHGVANDFLQIGYRGKDRLYVPIDRLHSVSKYKGLSEKIPKLDRLGSQAWNRIKKKVKEAVWAVAQDLLELYAKRELEVGRAYSQPDELYAELEESFPYDETPGQNRAIQDVLGDLVSEKTMDRLLCGDVGYGKTEVAVRAALKVIEDGYQAAVLVPTTVLAEQHGHTFRERLAGFPVRVESLSRFRSRALQQEILRDLAAGRVDVIIGTHRLLSKDVRFHRLGLLVVDEEHRFGVSHKEKIKRLRTKVDVLTLSATPIPRTLQMSLLGVRDLSVIDTPPEQRRPVKTFVSRYDDLVIKEAVIREMQRQGQTFIVHNRVQSIHKMAQKVQQLVPDARVAVGHGQMQAKKLEEIMVRFINRELDVLVCTTIIESGLDITNANTIIINRADSLGLAEIYQLRGRVGRGSEQSYAYLLVPSLDGLTKDARDRLRALMDCSELGGGFKLALSDLQIRGGGNILGVSQSGHIEAVGYDLYLDLLQRTVTDLKNKTARDEERTEDVEPEINLQISAYIPDTYIADSNQRYLAYRRLSDLATPEILQDLQEEFRDRFGELPVEARNLFEIVALKMALRKIRIMKLEQGRDSLVFTFQEHTSVSPQAILRFMEEAEEGRVRFTPDARLIVQTSLRSAGEIFRAAAEVLSRLGE
jgi:transcription-repair coupling factor (superfamily II helicase)